MRILAIAGAAALLIALNSVDAAADSATPAPRTITVAGDAEARSAPDFATLEFAVETHAPTAAQAASDNADLQDKVVKALKSKLADKGTITSSGYAVSPEYSQGQNVIHPKIVGYMAQNSVRVETSAIDLPGALIDAGISAGANRVNGLEFSLKNDTEARNRANATAAQNARGQAQALASALGVKLGPLMNATTLAESPMPRVYAAAPQMAYGAARVATPVEAGLITVTSHVTLTYEVQ